MTKWAGLPCAQINAFSKKYKNSVLLAGETVPELEGGEPKRPEKAGCSII